MTSQVRIDDRYDVSSDAITGGFGRIWRAHDRTSGREVSLQIVPIKDLNISISNFARDLQLSARLKHPNILDVLHVGETTLAGEQVTYIVMPLLPGRFLAEVMQEHGGPIEIKRAVDITRQLGTALDAIHSHHIVHRDLKPTNILLSDAGSALIVDFGLSRFVSGRDALYLAGSLSYMAPEQILGLGNVSAATDIYSLAMIAYELVTGMQPFAKQTPSETSKAILYDPLPRAGSFNPHVTSELESVLSRALSKEPQRRYWSARHFCDDLSAATNPGRGVPDATDAPETSAIRSIGEWRVRIDEEIEHLSPIAIEGLLTELSRLSGDEELKILRVERGSVILVLEGSTDGYKVIEHLVRTGSLKEILGLRIQDVQFDANKDQHRVVEETLCEAESASSAGCAIFISYSHKDDKLRHNLSNHLISLERQGVINQWHDRKITAGKEWVGEVDQRIETSQIILLLVSPDFTASQYCYDKEMKRALERHERRESRVVPIILRPVDWHQSPFGKLQALPKDGKPVTLWANRDEAFSTVAQDLRRTASEIRAGVW